MPTFEWNSGTNRYDTDTLVDCALAPANNDDLVNKLYCDTAVGGSAIFMSQYATPQLAVAAAIASGVNAIFVDDMFTITTPVLINGATLALIGLGKDTGFIVDAAAATGALNVSVVDVTLQNFHIEMTQCVAAAACVLINNADNFIARGISIHVPALVVTATGFDLQNSLDIRLIDCDVDIAGTCTVAAYLTDAHCTGMVMHDCYGAGSVDGINTDSAYIKIANCSIYAVTGEGIRVQAAGTNAVIADNHIDIVGANGILLEAVAGIIKGNNIGGTTAAGVYMLAGADECTISGNMILNAGTDGIYLANTDYCVVSGNNIDTAGSNGVELDGASTRNQVSNNVTQACTTDGIFLDNTCTLNLVALNQVPNGLTMGTDPTNEDYHNMGA